MKFIYFAAIAAFSFGVQAKTTYHVKQSGGHGASWGNMEVTEMKLPPDQLEGLCEMHTGDPIPIKVPCRGVSVEVKDGKGRTVASTQTNAEGRFSFSGLIPASYELTLKSKYFKAPFYAKGVATGGSYNLIMDPPKSGEGGQ